jgi:hypothetical protein
VTSSGPDLPFVDEHAVSVSAPASAVWRAIGRSLPRSRASRLYVAAIGGEPARAHGDPLAEGSALPGFAVREADPGRRLVLAGRHWFSVYCLTFTLDEDGPGTRLTARTDAAFPGPHGAAYRSAVIGSGAHRRVVRRWLRGIARAAEAAAREG